MLSKNVLLYSYSSMKKRIEKDSDDFWQRKLTLKVQFWHFLTPPRYTNSQNSIISFGYVDFQPKTFLILYPSLENSITGIAIKYKKGPHKMDYMRHESQLTKIEIVISPNGRSSFKCRHALASVHHGICHPQIVINMPHFI